MIGLFSFYDVHRCFTCMDLCIICVYSVDRSQKRIYHTLELKYRQLLTVMWMLGTCVLNHWSISPTLSFFFVWVYFLASHMVSQVQCHCLWGTLILCCGAALWPIACLAAPWSLLLDTSIICSLPIMTTSNCLQILPKFLGLVGSKITPGGKQLYFIK